VHRAVELLGKKQVNLDSEATIAELIGGAVRLNTLNLNAVFVEELAVLEAEQAGRGDVDRQGLLHEAVSALVLRELLGAAAKRTTWDPRTVWARSVRGVINERVRWQEGCMCARVGRPTSG
jgi:hypothetical protein